MSNASNPLTQSAHFRAPYPEFHLTRDMLETHANQTHRAEKVFYQLFLFFSFFHRKTLQSIAHIIEPLPGAGKESCVGRGVKRWTYRAFYLCLAVITVLAPGLPFALVIQKIIVGTLSVSAISSAPFWLYIVCGYLLLLLIALAFYFCAYRCKPMVRYSFSPTQNPSLTQKLINAPLHVRTFNTGCIHTSLEIVADLRRADVRADEIAHWIEHGENQPDIIFFQEVFRPAARELLCERLKHAYPYMLHSLAPHPMGFDSGFMIVSKYPIEHASFRPFNDMMIGPERWSNRGLAKIRVTAQNGSKCDFYVTHLQALLGKDRSEMRKTQMEWIRSKIENDQESDPADRWVLCGDMNASEKTLWAEENDEDTALLRMVEEEWGLKDLHKRVKNQERWVEADTPDGLRKLDAPTATLCIGPWENKGLLMTFKEMIERRFYGVSVKKVDTDLRNNLCLQRWGTSSWHAFQQASTARLDRVYVDQVRPRDYSEIRRVKVPSETESAPSDHLPLDFMIDV